MIVHYFGIYESKRVFYANGYGIARCQDAIANPENFDLEPLLVLYVTHQDLSLSYRQFCLKQRPISASQVLSEYWGASTKKPYHNNDCEREITGTPDLLVIDKRLENTLRPHFYDWLKMHGVAYEFSDGKNRKFAAKMRASQEYPHTYCGRYEELMADKVTGDC